MLTFITSNTFAFVGEIRTFVRVQVGAFNTFLAVSEPPKCIADLGCWVDAYVRKATVLICTPPFLEVEASWDVVWGGFVRERAVIPSVAVVLE